MTTINRHKGMKVDGNVKHTCIYACMKWEMDLNGRQDMDNEMEIALIQWK
jgi:hypothetical protein